jgi:histidyl-tRNA synthetase
MAKRGFYKTVKGTRDLLPPETQLWNRVEQTARHIFGSYGFEEIRPPIFESTELFKRAVGDETDIVGKEMYTFVDRDESSISLRPEGTASVCRAYIEHGMDQLPQPVRLYYVGPMFRREKPQKGRYRQFYQIGAEVLETVRPNPNRDSTKEAQKDAAVDAEVVEMLMAYFDMCGLRDATLYVNSIGCSACRAVYVESLRAALLNVRDQLSSDSQRRISSNPLRVLDSKEKSEQTVIDSLPKITEYLCGDCGVHFNSLKRELQARGVRFIESWRLVRGLDYYMRTTFEITATGLGSQSAVCGGGRYDGLVESLGGPPTKGIGFAIGEDRLILSLTETLSGAENMFDEGLPNFSAALQRPDIAVAGTTGETWDRAVQVALAFRKRGLSVYLPKSGTKMQRVFDLAHKLGARVVIVVGEDELKNDQYAIRILSPLVPEASRDVSVGVEQALLYGKIVKLRQDLERAMLRLAAGKPELDRLHSLPALVDRLLEKNLLPPRTAAAVKDVLPTLNRSIHGHDLSTESVPAALAFGNLLLNELESLSPTEV